MACIVDDPDTLFWIAGIDGDLVRTRRIGEQVVPLSPALHHFAALVDDENHVTHIALAIHRLQCVQAGRRTIEVGEPCRFGLWNAQLPALDDENSIRGFDVDTWMRTPDESRRRERLQPVR